MKIQLGIFKNKILIILPQNFQVRIFHIFKFFKHHVFSRNYHIFNL